MSVTSRPTSNPWADRLDRSSSEEIEDDLNEVRFQRREENGVLYESRLFEDEIGNICKETTKYRSVCRRSLYNKARRDRIKQMELFGKELKAGTKAGTSERWPEVMDWTRDKMLNVASAGTEQDYSLTCYGNADVDNIGLRRKANILEDLFKKLDEQNILRPEELEKAAPTGPGGRPSSAMTNREPRRQLGGGQEDRTIRVSNLTDDVHEKHLNGLFKSLGSQTGGRETVKIEKCYIPKDEHTQKSRGFAFVTFSDAKYAKLAIEKLNGHTFSSVVLSVEMAKPPKSRTDGEERQRPRQ